MKRSPPDKRLNWRDPDMPVVRNYPMRDGSFKTIVEPAFEQGFRQIMMERNAHEDWRDDPTYNMKKERR